MGGAKEEQGAECEDPGLRRGQRCRRGLSRLWGEIPAAEGMCETTQGAAELVTLRGQKIVTKEPKA